MAYLFWAFAAVWIGLFLYLALLMRRSQALARDVEALLEESRRPRRTMPSEERPVRA
jgi:CcmD family protein